MENQNNQNNYEEIKGLESRLKTLKQQSRGGQGNPYTIPVAVIIAGVLIAGAVVYSSGNNANVPTAAGTGSAAVGNTQPQPTGPAAMENVKPVTDKDHILGSPDAQVMIVEFSDLECPFCKRFHPTLQQIMDEYGKNGQVAWVYRHFPLDSIHSKARKEAEATECANELGGNDAFWAYLDRIFEITPANNGLDLNQLPQIAEYVGLDRAKFQSCLDSGKYAQHVSDDLADATNSGGRGTPWSIVIAKNGKKFPLSGAQPYAEVKSVIDLALQEK